MNNPYQAQQVPSFTGSGTAGWQQYQQGYSGGWGNSQLLPPQQQSPGPYPDSASQEVIFRLSRLERLMSELIDLLSAKEQ